MPVTGGIAILVSTGSILEGMECHANSAYRHVFSFVMFCNGLNPGFVQDNRWPSSQPSTRTRRRQPGSRPFLDQLAFKLGQLRLTASLDGACQLRSVLTDLGPGPSGTL